MNIPFIEELTEDKQELLKVFSSESIIRQALAGLTTVVKARTDELPKLWYGVMNPWTDPAQVMICTTQQELDLWQSRNGGGGGGGTGTGPRGYQGNRGYQGVQGADGVNGVQGPQGQKGDQGTQGAQGIQGKAGAQGDQGHQGDAGAQGEQGEAGPRGYQGLQGTQGAAGTQGDQGETGPQGTQGPQGDKGDQGAEGQGISLKGTVETATDLPSTADDGDCYLTNDDGNLHVYVAATSSWKDLGQLRGPQGLKGDQGSQGDAGAQGAQGHQGSQGVQGAQGVEGDNAYEVACEQGFQGTEDEWLASLKGAQGDQGSQGADGTQGPQGDQGEAGSQGSQGDQGVQGAQGSEGVQGSQGHQGEAGPQGDQGETGSQGDRGFQGDQGDQGPQGDKGDQGDTGSQGDQGPQGNQGTQGIDGSQGPQGQPGAVGSQGADGVQGPQGVQGVTGAQGPEGKGLTVKGTVPSDSDLPSTAADGDIYLVTMSGELKIYSADSASWTSLGVLKGPQGVQGSDGVQGPQGATGAQGEQGAEGPQGLAGSQGVQGTQGTEGTQGPQGVPGLQGPQGDQGNIGNQGYQGDQGVRGFQGEPGQGLNLKGSVATADLLPGDTADGDAYLVTEDGSIHIFSASSNSWTSLGALKGPQGSQGDQGARGYQGEQGVQGSQGRPFVLSGTVTSLTDLPTDAEIGDAYVVDDVKRLYIKVDGGWQDLGSFAGYRGYQGETGAQGTQGPQGYQGAQGPEGPKGDQGEVGLRGYQGDTGSQGVDGAQGLRGYQGDNGPQGDQGYQGVQGERGYRGYQGFRGYQGVLGEKGTRGYQGVQGPMGAAGDVLRLKGRVEEVSQLDEKLPTAQVGDLWLVGVEGASQCDQYAYTFAGQFEKIGTTGSVNLDDYYTKEQADQAFAAKGDALTADEKQTLETIVLDGDGTKYLNDKGKYTVVESGTTDYADLDNKPKLNGVILAAANSDSQGQSNDDLGIVGTAISLGKEETDKITVVGNPGSYKDGDEIPQTAKVKDVIEHLAKQRITPDFVPPTMEVSPRKFLLSSLEQEDEVVVFPLTVVGTKNDASALRLIVGSKYYSGEGSITVQANEPFEVSKRILPIKMEWGAAADKTDNLGDTVQGFAAGEKVIGEVELEVKDPFYYGASDTSYGSLPTRTNVSQKTPEGRAVLEVAESNKYFVILAPRNARVEAKLQSSGMNILGAFTATNYVEYFKEGSRHRNYTRYLYTCPTSLGNDEIIITVENA